MLSRFSSLRFLAANVSKLAATRRTTPRASNLLLHTSNDVRRDPEEIEYLSDFDDSRSEEADYVDPEHPEALAAVLVAGCGHLDGSVPLEVMSLLIHLKYRGVTVHLYGPNDPTNDMFKIDHLTGTRTSYRLKPAKKVRHMFPGKRIVEWGQLLQGNGSAIRNYEAVFIPGGEGLLMTPLNDNLHNVVRRISLLGTPLATISNAGVLAAWALARVRITVGSEENRGHPPYDYAASYVQLFNGQMQNEGALGVAYDENYKVYSTPGYLDHLARYSDVHDGIGRLVNRVLENRNQQLRQ